jgi:hypothetical protein
LLVALTVMSPPRLFRSTRPALVRQKLPAWVKVVADPNVPADRHAEYVFEMNGNPRKELRHDALMKRGVTVRVRPDVFASDEAIVGVLRHEQYELTELATKLESAKMTKADVRAHVEAGRGQNLHGQAWDVADLEVRIMRESPGTPKHAQLVRQREALLARFDVQNHGEVR